MYKPLEVVTVPKATSKKVRLNPSSAPAGSVTDASFVENQLTDNMFVIIKSDFDHKKPATEYNPMFGDKTTGPGQKQCELCTLLVERPPGNHCEGTATMMTSFGIFYGFSCKTCFATYCQGGGFNITIHVLKQ
jgi:hypothetical protein